MVHKIDFVRVNSSIMEIKSYSSGFNHVQPSIKGIRWWFLGDSVNLNQKIDLFFGTIL